MKTGYRVNKWYTIKEADGREHKAQFIGRQSGFECCVCGKGCNAYTFNIWYDKDGGYETWGYGADHLPELIEDLGKSEEPILDK